MVESNSVKIIPITATLVVVPMNATVRPGDNQSHNFLFLLIMITGIKFK